MKTIKLNCLFDSQVCNFVDSQQNFQLNDPAENNFSLEINNLSLKNCDFYIKTKQLSGNEQADEINLLISRDNEIVYQESLDKFFQQKVNLGELEKQSNKQYFFIFDLSHLFFNPDKIELDFDLLLDFNCWLPELEIEKFTPPAQTQKIHQASGSVLASNNQVIAPLEGQFNFPIFLLLSILFVFLFFVIIKIVNGKKKKK